MEYITVHFEDGPDVGLLAAVCEDDAKDCRYLRYIEVHLKHPAVKVLFGDGVQLFTDKWPDGAQGVVVDEDGDAHRYTLQKDHQADPATHKAQDDANSLPAPVSVHHNTAAATDSAVAAKGVESEAPFAVFEALDALNCSDVSESPGDAFVSGRRPAATKSISARQRRSRDDEDEDWCSPPAAAKLQRCNPSAGACETSDKDQQQENAVLLIEHAKSSRSTCKTCAKLIAQGALRCGIWVSASGRRTIVWAHAHCFLRALEAEYCANARGKCKCCGEAFVKGDMRVSFCVGHHRIYLHPVHAARLTPKLVLEVQPPFEVGVDGGFESLDPRHRAILCEALSTGHFGSGADSIEARQLLHLEGAELAARLKTKSGAAVSTRAAAGSKNAVRRCIPAGVNVEPRTPVALSSSTVARVEFDLDDADDSGHFNDGKTSGSIQLELDESDDDAGHSDDIEMTLTEF